MFIEEDKKTFFVYYGQYKIEYDFYGKAINPKALLETQLAIYDGYQCLHTANEIISCLSSTFSAEEERKLLLFIDRIDNGVSPYQRSLMYKALGECYAKYSMKEKAISAYEQGLSLNPKLPVKKIIKRLTDS